MHVINNSVENIAQHVYLQNIFPNLNNTPKKIRQCLLSPLANMLPSDCMLRRYSFKFRKTLAIY